MDSQETPASWSNIASRKRAHRDSLIPPEWTLDAKYIPKEDGSPEKVLFVPEQCGLLTAKIASKRLKARHVTLAFCKRAAIAQQLTNCLTEPLFASAVHRADFLDQYFAEHGEPFGPLHGLPISLKDTFKIAGVDSSNGLAALCFKPATSNSPLVDLLLSLGCVIIAKTNVPQTLGSLDSINSVFGRTMNPISRLVTAGGSSGGEGVLVAMKRSMIGVGTDIGGSIRIPAMCSGVYGLKPSVGRGAASLALGTRKTDVGYLV